MTHRLGIENLPAALDTLEEGGLYYIGVRSEEDALRLLISARKASGLTTSVLMEDDPVFARALEPFAAERFDFSVYRDPEIALFYELDYFLHEETVLAKSLFIALLTHELEDTEEALQEQLRRLEEQARKMRLTVLLIYCGVHARDLTEQLRSQSVFFRGIAHLTRDTQRISYAVPLWASEQGLLVQQHCTLGVTGSGAFVALHREKSADNVFLDAHELLICGQSKLKSRYDWNPGARIFRSNAEVFEAAAQSQAATLIFSLNRDDELPELVRFIHTLRVENGAHLKIVVTEEHLWMRAINEATLLEAGANLVFQNQATPTYMTTMIHSIQGNVYQNPVIESFETFTRSLEISQYKGLVEFGLFRDLVLAAVTVSSEYVFSHGALVRLRPKEFISERRVIQEARFQRGGDIITLFGTDYLAFLWGCNPKDTEAVLRRVFAVPPETLFKGYFAQHNDRNIRKFLEGAPDYGQHPVKPFGRKPSNLHTFDLKEIAELGQKGKLTPRKLPQRDRLRGKKKETP